MSIPFFILISYIVGSKISTAALLTIGIRLEKRKVFTLLGEKLDPVHVEHI